MAGNHKQIKTTTMTQTNTITINGFSTHNIAPCEAMGLSKCFEAYASIGEEIMEDGIGFNPNSGYVYIALENGISICSMLGREVEYIIFHPETSDETFCGTYEEAQNIFTEYYNNL
jgi:hypothetical protein